MQCWKCKGEVVEVSIVKIYSGERSAKVCTGCGMIDSQYRIFKSLEHKKIC